MIELNKVFTIEKGNRKMKQKIVKHPYFDSYVVVREHLNIKSGIVTKDDINHICGASSTVEKAYSIAYDLTVLNGGNYDKRKIY